MKLPKPSPDPRFIRTPAADQRWANGDAYDADAWFDTEENKPVLGVIGDDLNAEFPRVHSFPRQATEHKLVDTGHSGPYRKQWEVPSHFKTLVRVLLAAGVLAVLGVLIAKRASPAVATAQAQTQAAIAARALQQRNHAHITQCLATRGDGAAPVFDDAGQFVACLPRRTS